MVELKEFSDKVLQLVQVEVLKIIDESIKDSKELAEWIPLNELSVRAGGKHAWVTELVRSITSSFQFLEKYKTITETPEFERMVVVKIDKTGRPLEMLLSVSGLDADVDRNIRAVFYGGEFKEGDKTLIIDANSGIGQIQVESAANKLRDYFIKQLAEKIEKDLK